MIYIYFKVWNSSHTESLRENMISILEIHMYFSRYKTKSLDCKICHCDQHLFWGQTLGHTDPLSVNMVFICEKLFKIEGKFNGLWIIGYCGLHLFGGQTSGHTDIIEKVWCLYMKYASEYKTKITGPWKLQDVRQNYRTMKYRSCWHHFMTYKSMSQCWLMSDQHLPELFS